MKAKIGNKTVSPWRLRQETYTTKDGQKKSRTAILRWVVPDGKPGTNERYPVERYSHIQEPEELKAFVRRLNAEVFREQEALENILDRTAFLNNGMLEKYRAYLENHIPSELAIEYHMNMLKTHVINVLVGELHIVNPKEWVTREDDYYNWLLGPKAPGAVETKKKILQCLNRFYKWLHKQRPNEIPLAIFEGPGFERMRKVERMRAHQGEKIIRKAIAEKDWEKIEKSLPDDIGPWIRLCYRYGLRRSESLGLAYEGTNCVFTKHLTLKKQLKKWNPKTQRKEFAPLKTAGRQPVSGKEIEYRKIPHWFDVDPNDTCDLIEEGLKNLMTPTTLTKKWASLMDSLGFDYHIHDLRHTWITRARAKYPSREVQLAAGHASIETTERYSHDHRESDEQLVRPSKKAA